MRDCRSSGGSTFEFEALNRAYNYRAALVREFRRHLRGRVLEVGAGVGHMTAALSEIAGITEMTAVEPDSRFLHEFRVRMPATRLIHGTSEHLAAGDRYDCIVMVNVLEHVERDVEELARLRSHLNERDGRLCMYVPARPELYAQIDRMFGHYRRYRRSGMSDVLCAAGYRPLDVRYFNFVGYLAWYCTFKIAKRTSFNPRSVKIFDGCIFPVTDAIERWIGPPPIGQGLLAVAAPK